jgi:hypothetical protein
VIRRMLMTDKPDGGPAFPRPASLEYPDGPHGDLIVECTHSEGMTLRQYAAIHLKVPDSGEDWLDEMILESRRLDFAGQAMQSHLCRDKRKNPFTPADLAVLTADSYAVAEYMRAEIPVDDGPATAGRD